MHSSLHESFALGGVFHTTLFTSLSFAVPKSADVDVLAESDVNGVVGMELCTVLVKLELEYVKDENVGLVVVVRVLDRSSSW